jgi:lipid A ethanolaminephosphotransferase
MASSKTKRFNLSHISFSLIFTTLLYVICNSIYIDKITKWFPLGDGIDYAGLIAFLTFGLCLFIAVFILLAHRWTIKPLAIIFIILSAAATYFISKYDVAIDRTMVMNTLNTDPTEASGFLSIHMIPYAFFLIVLPILLILNVNITFNSAVKYLSTSFLIFTLSLVVGTGMIYLKYNSIHRAANLSDKYIIHTLVPVNIIRSLASVAQRSIQSYYKKHKQPVVITGHVSSQDDLVVVLVVGEASRKKSFSLYGYEKNTNPVLSKDKDLHLLTATATIGTTLLALPQILEKDDIKLPAITSKLGIDTSCYVNFTLYDNCDAVGEVRVSDCGHDGNCYDEDVIPLLSKNLKTYTSGHRFIILHAGGGSHGPKYTDRYPPEFQQFNPQCLDPDVLNQCTIEQLYNSYDNTILYVDYVLGKVIQVLDDSKLPYVFIYLSDHGESLMENGRIFHGMPPGIALPPEQAEVPLIVKSSIPISVVKREQYMQQDVYDTVLDLLSIESKVLDKERVFIKKIN